MKKTQLLIFLIVIVMVVMCMGCSDGNKSAKETNDSPIETSSEEEGDIPVGESSLVGSWKNEINFQFTFNEDGTGTFNMNGMELPFDYEIDGDTLKVVTMGAENAPDFYKFKVEGDVFSFGELETFSSTGYTDEYNRIK
ncbi:DUF5640 domain-containing protein [Alkaliphilus serpentinus]|uniref:DUF5640 domain-containing protein n=1 Tax=Alkaliphilus serpentinus TaxID=1482731 RepID=A0A833HNG5_9FIRM|nr:DUF5640 domain-containing protein [Alkaliphilus serpentinus]KAB3529316.1 hypothetical protein F8153_09440 [Alkaliphilus serpentinus]